MKTKNFYIFVKKIYIYYLAGYPAKTVSLVILQLLMYALEAAKKILFLVVRPLRGGGVKALVVGPLKKLLFFAASLMQYAYCGAVSNSLIVS